MYSSEHGGAAVSFPSAASMQFARFDIMGSVGSAITSEVLLGAGDGSAWSSAERTDVESGDERSKAEGSEMDLPSTGIEGVSGDSHHLV